MHFIRPWLAIGKYRETLDAPLPAAQGIGAMLQLAEAVEHPGISSLYLTVDDGVPLAEYQLRRGVEFVLTEKSAGHTVLIACGAGISRSATFSVAALKEAEGLHLPDAMRAVRQQHPDALPHPELWDSLCSYYQEPVSFHELLRSL